MAIKAKQLQELARGCKFSYKTLKQVYDHMEENKVPDSEIELQLMEETIVWMEQQEVSTFEAYKEVYDKSVEVMRKATSLDRKENTSEEMRKKLGYNNAQWKVVTSLEKTMVVELQKLIVEFMSSTIVNNKSFKPEEIIVDKFFLALDLRWRNFSRSYLIPKYPGARTNSGLRTRITGLFSTKLLEALKKNVPEEKPNTASSDIVEEILS